MVALVQSHESRRAKRLDVVWKGTITHGVGREAIVCVIKDISPNGAQLVVAAGERVPDKFLLKVANGSKMFRCQIVWQKGQMLGVRFVGTYPRWNQG